MRHTGDVAGEGLLAVFFFVAGLELRRELTDGELRGARRAALPVVAALAGMAGPALVFLVVAGGVGGRGWAVPVATDIAFALGVLALSGGRYPPPLRALLLSLAVVDDLGAIVLIAVLFAHGVHVLPLLGALVACVAYARLRTPYARVPLAVATWLLVHLAGVHATVAGVVLGLLTAPGGDLEERLHPWSAGLVVPVFAFTAAGVHLGGVTGAVHDRVAWAVFAGLLLGKTLGIAGGVALATRLRIATAPEHVRAYDVAALGVLGGVGFTVSLLLADLAYDGPREAHAKAAVLAASVVASAVAAVMLRRRPGPAPG